MDVVMLGIQVYIGIQVYFFHYLKALETEKPVGLHSSSEFFHSSKISPNQTVGFSVSMEGTHGHDFCMETLTKEKNHLSVSDV